MNTPTVYVATVRLHATGTSIALTFDSALARALMMISMSGYADVISQEER